MNAKNLIDNGYAVVSRHYGIISRIDRPDWKEFCTKNHHPVNADWYRRCLSKDTMIVDHSLVKEIPNSGNCPYEFKEKREVEV